MPAYTLGLITETADETVDQGLITNSSTTQEDYGLVSDPITYSVQLTGLQVTSEISTVTVSVTDTEVIDGVEAQSQLGEIQASGERHPTISVTGIQVASEFGSVTVSVTDTELITGIELQSELGNITVSSTRNPTALISGLQSQSALGQITVNAEGRQITGARKSKKKAYFLPFKPIPITTEVVKNGVAKIDGKLLSADRSIIRASGTISISTIAKISPVKSKTEMDNLTAGGIINPTDDEIIWLLAA